ncbi:MAG: type II toxin-antitoxin system VapC family toxin [Spartobacteria bacterium]
MIYCDTAYLLKYYVDEPGTKEVRSLIDRQTGVGSLSLGRLELATAFHRKLRESQIEPAMHECLISQCEADNMEGLWTWFDATPDLVDKASKNFGTLPAKIFLRASDALHLACAKEHGFREIHSNDKHLLAAAKHFGLKGRNVIK